MGVGAGRIYPFAIALLASPLLLVAADVAAQSVVLDLHECAEPTAPAAEEVRALLALELRERLLPPAAVAPAVGAAGAGAEERLRAGSWTVAVSCADQLATLRVLETGASRVVALNSVPEPLRPRLLALSIAELATRISEPPDPPPARKAAAAPAAAAASATPGRSPTEASAAQRPPRGMVALSAGAELTPLLGVVGALSLALRLRGPLFLYVALELAQARTEIDHGRARVRSATVRLGPALALERARFAAFAALGVRAAVQQFAGEPDDRELSEGRSFHQLSFAPSAIGAAQLRLSPRWFLSAELALSLQLRAQRLSVRGGESRTLSPFESALRAGGGVAW
jgi:hypothetical protein